MTEFVDGDSIYTQARGAEPPVDPTDRDLVWAGMCADAVNEAMTLELATGAYVVVADSDAEKALQRAALLDGVAAYADRDAPSGVLTMGPDGQPIRVRADVLRAAVPVIDRFIHALPGIA